MRQAERPNPPRDPMLFQQPCAVYPTHRKSVTQHTQRAPAAPPAQGVDLRCLFFTNILHKHPCTHKYKFSVEAATRA